MLQLLVFHLRKVGFIKKGDLIAQLDDSQLSAEVNRTEALYTQSKAAYKRIKSIVDQNAGTPAGS